MGANPLLQVGNGRFPSGAAVKAAQTQPAFITTLWREPERRAFPEMPVWNKNNLKILHFNLFSHITSLCCSPPHPQPHSGFFCLHPSLACALQAEIPGLQTAEPAVRCHVKGKQTPAIQELKWLSWSVVSFKMESTKQIVLETTGADFAVPGEVVRLPLVCCVGTDGITNRDVLFPIPPSVLLLSCTWCRSRNQQWDPLEEKGQSHAPRSALTSCCQCQAFRGEHDN